MAMNTAFAPRGRLVPLLDREHTAAKKLMRDGYAIVTVCTPERAAELASSLWYDIEKTCPGVDRDKPKTWTNERWLQTTHELAQNQQIGMMQGVCEARVETMQVWSTLFGGQRVISSFDAVSLARPAQQGRKYAAELSHQRKHGESQLLSSWLHTDQAKAKTECLRHIQGAFALTALGVAEQRTQLVVPKEGETMQSFRDRFLAAFPPGQGAKAKDIERREWVPHTHKAGAAEEREWLLENGRVITPVLAAGEMLLWDSGVPHASTPGPLPEGQTERAMRMTTFVSALPIELVEKADLELRREMLERGVTSGHRVTEPGATKAKPYIACKFSDTGRTWGKPLPNYSEARVVVGFRRSWDAGAKATTAYKMAKHCGGYGHLPTDAQETDDEWDLEDYEEEALAAAESVA